MKRILVIESCPGTPHTDTGLEIVLKEAEAGSKVYYACLFPHNGVWEYSNQYPDAAIKPLSGFILYNIREICNAFNIPVVFPDIQKFKLTDEEFKKYIQKKTKFKNVWDLERIVMSTISSFTRLVEPDLLSDDLYDIAFKYTEVAISTYFASENLLRRITPDLVYYYNGRWCSCAPIEWAAKDLNIKSLVHERGSSTNRFSLYAENPYRFDVLNRDIKKATNGIDPEILRVIGSQFFVNKQNRQDKHWPSFALNQKRGLIPDELKNKKYISYFTTSEDEFSQIPGNKIEIYFGKQFEAFSILKNICKDLRIPLVVRVHPNILGKQAEEKFWASQADENTIVFNASDSIDTYSLVNFSYAVVSYSTSVGMEAVFMGRPSILLGNSVWYGEPEFLCPRNESELFAYLQSPNQRKNELKFTYAYGYYMENFGEKFKFFKPDNFWSGKLLGHRMQPLVVF
jgi:hypothetical protein